MIAVFVFFFLLVIGTPIALVVLFTSLVGTLTYSFFACPIPRKAICIF